MPGIPQIVAGKVAYPLTAERVRLLRRRPSLAAGVDVIGGCCGTDPEFVREIAGRSPRPETPVEMGAVFFLLCMLLLFLRGDLALLRAARRGRAGRHGQKSATASGRWRGSSSSWRSSSAGCGQDFNRYPGALPRVFMIVSNHQSLADIPAVTCAFPGTVCGSSPSGSWAAASRTFRSR